MKRIVWGLIVLIIGITVISVINNREEREDFLDEELIALENYFGQREVQNVQVSQAAVSWHLDHTLKTINTVCTALQASNPQEYNSKFNFQRVLVHTLGNIPRGVAQSPASVRPPEVVHLDSLLLQLEEAKKRVQQISELEEQAYFEHPVFDHLDRDQTRRFLDVHTNHHLKIIRDILEE